MKFDGIRAASEQSRIGVIWIKYRRRHSSLSTLIDFHEQILQESLISGTNIFIAIERQWVFNCMLSLEDN
jgi:hypothetical protein